MSKHKKIFKGKKTVDLKEFLDPPQVNPGFRMIQCQDGSGSDMGAIILPTAPISSRGGLVDETKVPRDPPYVAFLGNLPFEILEDEVGVFFKNLKLTSVRFVKDGDHRFRGFGYAEFEDRASLIEALGLDGEQLRNREIRVGLPNDDGDGRGGYGRRDGMRSGFGSRSERPVERDLPNDWRAAAREEQSNRSASDNYGRQDRYGGRDGFRDGGRDYGRDSYRDGGRDSYRDGGGRDSYRDGESWTSRQSSDNGPTERPKLKVAPRTKPVEPIQVTPIEPEKPKVEKPKIEKPKAADIFGAAKPVDTAAKLREIEERLEAKQKEQQEKALKEQAKTTEAPKSGSPQNQPAEPPKKWREEARENKDWNKDRKPRSERRIAPQAVDEPEFVATSKNKFADLEVSENREDSDADIQVEN